MDLRLIGNKSKVIPKTSNQSQKTATVLKRKAEKTSDEVKPKLVKHSKIPDWDYKARYNQLREKFSSLNEDFKKQHTRIEG